MDYHQVGVLGGKGAEPHQFTTALRGVAVDEGNRVFAVGDSEVKVFDSTGKLSRRWPTSRPGHSVAVGVGVYVGQQGQVEIYDSSGKLLDTWRDPKHLGLVTAIGLLPDDVLIADARDRSIRRYDRQGNLPADAERPGVQLSAASPSAAVIRSKSSKL